MKSCVERVVVPREGLRTRPAAITSPGKLLTQEARLRFVDAPSIRFSSRLSTGRLRRIATVALLTSSWTLGTGCENGQRSTDRTGLHTQQVIRLQRIARTQSDRLSDLGGVVDAVRDPQGRLFILDRTGPGIVVTDDNLQPLGYFGQRGSGPGEFREPVAIGIHSDGHVAVLDRALARVTILAVSDGGRSLLPQHTVFLGIPSESMCILRDNTLLIYGFSAGARLHIFGLDARLLRSFGPADSTFSPMALDLLTQGRIACDELLDEVLVSSKFLPVVEAFRISTGERIWVGSLRPFRALTVTDQGGRVSISSDRAGFSTVSSLFSIGDYRVFQTVYASRLDTVDVDTVVSYVYSRRRQDWIAPEFHAPLLFPLGGEKALSVTEGDRVEIELNHLTVGDDRAKGRSTNGGN